MTAVEVLKIILGLPGLQQEVLVYEATSGMIIKHRMKGKQRDCICCGQAGFDLVAYDYAQLVKPSKTLLELLEAVPDGNKMEAGQYFKDWEGKPQFILDVRVPIQFSMYHFPGAVNIPLSQLNSYIVSSTQPDIASVAETQTVFVVCRRGIAAAMASAQLAKAGVVSKHYVDFFVIVGGLNACAKVNPKVPFY